jgi:hypothetical protein
VIAKGDVVEGDDDVDLTEDVLLLLLNTAFDSSKNRWLSDDSCFSLLPLILPLQADNVAFVSEQSLLLKAVMESYISMQE